VDDAVHAEENLTVDVERIQISSSYEGLEGQKVIINGGTIDIHSSDDAINAAGDTEERGMSMDNGYEIVINGGTITIDAGGDGIDSNGSITMTDGIVYVSGPTNNGNGAIDYNSAFTMNGGTLIAAGSSGMAQAPSDSSAQGAIIMTYSAAQAAGTTVTLADETGNVLLSYAPEKTFQSIVFGSKEIDAGNTYSILTDGEETVSFTTENTITYVNESGITTGGNRMGPGGGGGAPENGGNNGGRGGHGPGGDGSTMPEGSDNGPMPGGTRPENGPDNGGTPPDRSAPEMVNPENAPDTTTQSE
jgi:hypothetical protein